MTTGRGWGAPGVEKFREFTLDGETFEARAMTLAPYDEISGAPYWIDVAHWEIHIGRMYHAEYTASVTNGAQANLLFVTGDTPDHVIFEVAVGGQALVQMWEAPTITEVEEVPQVGTEVASYNMNRLSENVAGTKLYHTPTITATGNVLLINRTIPGGATAQTRVGGQASKGVEWIFKPETAYLLRITNSSGGTIPVSGVFEWYEGGEGY